VQPPSEPLPNQADVIAETGISNPLTTAQTGRDF